MDQLRFSPIVCSDETYDNVATYQADKFNSATFNVIDEPIGDSAYMQKLSEMTQFADKMFRSFVPIVVRKRRFACHNLND